MNVRIGRCAYVGPFTHEGKCSSSIKSEINLKEELTKKITVQDFGNRILVFWSGQRLTVVDIQRAWYLSNEKFGYSASYAATDPGKVEF